MNKKIFGSGVVAVVATITFCNLSTSATDIVDEINITVPSSCSLSGTNLIHTANMENGQYKDNIGSANISAFCNDPNGFSIYAIGYTEDTYGNNKMHDPNLDTTHDINTGKYVSGTTTNSTWSMKLTPVTGPYAPTIRNDSTYNYTNYEVVPSEYTKVAYSSAATETGNGATGSNFTTSYAVFVSQSQNAGSYTGKVKFTLVHPENETPAQPQPCEAGKICYHANTTSVQGQMGKQSASNNTNTTLYAPNFKRTGYGFAGWNTAYDYSGTNYGPNQTITAPADVETNGLSLYAVWIKSQGTIQNWDGCDSLAQGATTALTDERDGNTYAVA
ncbi:InlB B-repeat-containing protein, partial [Candidatus Saccharibacteria bacterium]|nr:InlB B-repeat-containing protein [Candidatus Saccharibacteria bacterium]